MMAIDVKVQNSMDALQLVSTEPCDHKESSFQAFALTITSLDQIELGYMRICQMKRFADHIMLAYRLQDGENLKHGCAHDKEYYGDMEIMKAIK